MCVASVLFLRQELFKCNITTEINIIKTGSRELYVKADATFRLSDLFYWCYASPATFGDLGVVYLPTVKSMIILHSFQIFRGEINFGLSVTD